MYEVSCTGTSSLMCLAILVLWLPKPIPTYLYVVAFYIRMLSHTQSPVLMYVCT